MILLEDIEHYTKQDLFDKVNECEDLTDFTKSSLMTFIDNVSINLTELTHQLNRQPLPIDIFQKNHKLQSEFVILIMHLLDDTIYDKYAIDKNLDNYYSFVKSNVEEFQKIISPIISKNLDKCMSNMESAITNFKCHDNGLVATPDKFDNYDLSLGTNSVITAPKLTNYRDMNMDTHKLSTNMVRSSAKTRRSMKHYTLLKHKRQEREE